MSSSLGGRLGGVQIKLDHLQFSGGDKAIPTGTVMVTIIRGGQSLKSLESAIGGTTIEAMCNAVDRALENGGVSIGTHLPPRFKISNLRVRCTLCLHGEKYIGRTMLVDTPDILNAAAKAYVRCIELALCDEKQVLVPLLPEKEWRERGYACT